MEQSKKDRHHLLHPRSSYIINSPQYKLRTHRLLIPKIDYNVHHYELHHNVEAPPMPSNELATIAVSYLYLFDDSVNHLEAILALSKHLERKSYLGGEIADNLLRQLVYVEKGYGKE